MRARHGPRHILIIKDVTLPAILRLKPRVKQQTVINTLTYNKTIGEDNL